MRGDALDPAQPVSHPILVVGLAGSSFFLIGGPAMAIAAIVVASIPGIVLALRKPLRGRSSASRPSSGRRPA